MMHGRALGTGAEVARGTSEARVRARCALFLRRHLITGPGAAVATGSFRHPLEA